MKIWLKENWFQFGILVILTISVIGAFYWYGWRPTQIKKSCSIAARNFGSDLISQTKYENCLMRFGLK